MQPKKEEGNTNPAFKLKTTTFLPAKDRRHMYGKHMRVICVTDSKGNKEPEDRIPGKNAGGGLGIAEIRVGTGGFIPLWEKGVTLNWRFNKSFGSYFDDPAAAKAGIRALLDEAIGKWKEACPVKFVEVRSNWDFEIDMHKEDCDNTGCVLASSFFPGAGQDTFYIYPTMLEQTKKEQMETLEHEIGHIFGLRHFFANISERDLKSELFGTDSSFSIMNYGDESKLKPNDIKDLKHLYELVWNGELKEINGTPIKKFTSFHMK